eukprot:2041854-Amphidinium_carterae.1
MGRVPFGAKERRARSMRSVSPGRGALVRAVVLRDMIAVMTINASPAAAVGTNAVLLLLPPFLLLLVPP